MKNVLIVSGDFPYPPTHGARVDIWNRIKALHRLNYKIDLVVTLKDTNINKDHLSTVREFVERIEIVNRKNRLVDLFSAVPLQVKSRYSLETLRLSKKYDCIILEGDSVCGILKNNIDYKYIILRSHNNESVYFYNLYKSTNHIIKKIYYFTEYYKFKYFEPKLFKNIKNIMFISYDEKIKYDSILNLNTIFLPANINRNFLKQSLANNTVIAIGSLFMENNKEGIIWYIKKVHPLVTEKIKDYKLIVAGNSNGESIRWLYDLVRAYRNIEIYDTPETLDEIYASGSVFINPMFHGAGVKLKTIEAIVNGLPVVSTSIGNEGTGLRPNKDILVANDVIQYAELVIRLLNERGGEKQRIVDSAQNFIKLNYDTESILNSYLNTLKDK